MKHIILTYAFFLFVLAGCVEKQPNTLPAQDIKITDLAPINKSDIDNSLNTMNFEIVTFEIPSENLSILNEIWPLLYNKPIDLNNKFSFKANAFKTGFGEIQMWKQIGQILDNANASKYNTFRYLMTIEKSENMPIKKLVKPANIVYLDASLLPQTLKNQTGRVTLNIKADKPIGTRGVCLLSICPQFILDSPKDSRSNPFEHLGFVSKMTPGDFLILAPGKNYNQKDSLSRLFFYRNLGKPKMLLYAIFCMGIAD